MPECEFPQKNATAEEIRTLLTTAKTIAVVGFSPKAERPSHDIYFYLKSQGFEVFGVNPGHKTIAGETVYPSLLEIPKPVDIVDIFRNADAVGPIVDDAIAVKARAIWMQQGIVNNNAADKARAAGMTVVMNKCIYIEHRSLMS